MNTEQPAVGFVEATATLAMLIFLHKVCCCRGWTRAIEAATVDALSDKERQRQQSELTAEKLALERDEAHLVWTAIDAGLPAEHRATASPLAILQIVLFSVKTRPVRGSSLGHVLEIIGR